MRREGVKVAAKGLDVDLHVGHGLGTVEKDRHITLVSEADDLFDRVDGAESVGNMDASHDLGAKY